MILTRKIEQLQQLDQLIRLKSTGNSSQLAKRLKISESSLFLLLQTAKDLGAEINFNSFKNTYEYSTPMRFIFGFHVDDRMKLAHIKGGICFWNRFVSSFLPILNPKNHYLETI